MNNSLKLLTLSIAATLSLSACKKQESAPVTAPEATKLVIDESKLPPFLAFSASDLDANAAACNDFNQFVNGKWLAANPVPSDRTTWGSFELLGERSLATQRQIVESAAAMTNATGAQKLIGDLWATGMDEAAVEAAGIKPIQPFLDEIDALKTPTDIPGYLRKSASEGRMALFGIGGESDFKDSNKVIAYTAPDALGLPDKTYYFGDEHKAERDAYQAHIAATLKLAGAGEADATKQAAAIMAIETALAKVTYSSEELSRDVSKYYNPVTIDAANKITPAFDWGAYFDANGITRPEQFSLSNPDFFMALDGMFASVPMDDWKAYLRFHTVDGLSPYLSKAFVDQNFAFYGKTLRGQQEQKDRWKRVLGTVNDTAGEALGELYVEVAFPAESKVQMQKLVENLSAALKVRLENLEWMTPETRTKALEKWSSFTPKIGYPDKWREWDGLNTSRDTYVGNIVAGMKFNHAYEMAKIGKPKDRLEWDMTPQTVNAYYNPLMNEIVFPAAILQPPFFDPKADAPLNYGGIGAVIGHEMLHGYDDQGSRFDSKGSFVNWWQPSDATGFKSKTSKLVSQFDAYEAMPGKFVNGNLTLGENIADLGGLRVAHDALKMAESGKTDPKLDGYTQDQRFYMNWATIWRRNYTDKEMAVRLVTDSHAPAKFRAIGAPSNFESFAEAFGCKPGDAMVRPADMKIAIW